MTRLNVSAIQTPICGDSGNAVVGLRPISANFSRYFSGQTPTKSSS